jgi:transposase-like protein
MNPTTVFCPNVACPARGHTGRGNLGLHSQTEQRFICTPCQKTLTATKGTALSRLRTAAETVSLVGTRRAHGCPRHAIVAACGSDERTVACGLARAGGQGQAVQGHLVEPPRALGQVQADAMRVTTQGRIVWMALAMMVRTHLWRAGEVKEPRDRARLPRRIARVRRGAARRALVVCTAGRCASLRAMRETWRDPVRTGAHGRPRLRPWRNSCIAQVVKR